MKYVGWRVLGTIVLAGVMLIQPETSIVLLPALAVLWDAKL